MAQFLTLHTPRWWWRSFIAGLVFMFVFQRVFPDVIPWPEELPTQLRAILLLLVGIVIGAAIEACWWILTETWRRVVHS